MNVLTIFRASCREVSRLVMLRQDRPLTASERLAIRFHMRICDACPRFERQVGFMHAAMGRWRAYIDSSSDGR